MIESFRKRRRQTAEEHAEPRARGRASQRASIALCLLMLLAASAALVIGCSDEDPEEPRSELPYANEASLHARALDVRYDAASDSVVFEMHVQGDAGSVKPTPAGQVHGAPVLGYVFLTNLRPTDVGFDDVEGTVALAATSHPDFDDTPLWDEDGNADYDDDGAIYHAHWVVLVEDARAPAGLASRQVSEGSVLPPTAPMPMYLDSPGFTIVEQADKIRVIVPSDRIGRRFDLQVGGVVAYMQVDTSGETPFVAVHGLISAVDGGALSTALTGASSAPTSSWPSRTVTEIPSELSDPFDVQAAVARYSAEQDSFILSMRVSGAIGSVEPEPVGSVDGAPVLGYVFPTTIPPSALGFKGIEGIVVLAVTSHPDFDDTPLWDETRDGDYSNDGGFYHVHWAVLVEDTGSPAGFSVPSQSDESMLPPTAPMHMYLDSPGYHTFANGDELSVVIPAWHLRGVEGFSYDALTAQMRVDGSGHAHVLRVEQVYSVLSGDLSLPLSVSKSQATQATKK
ncbi:MAG: hypothetical protein KF915_18345 [Polyangiaceae bacterium]|nr:hypothetical protein [Polyangiaceae bacterium]